MPFGVCHKPRGTQYVGEGALVRPGQGHAVVVTSVGTLLCSSYRETSHSWGKEAWSQIQDNPSFKSKAVCNLKKSFLSIAQSKGNVMSQLCITETFLVSRWMTSTDYNTIALFYFQTGRLREKFSWTLKHINMLNGNDKNVAKNKICLRVLSRA